MNFNSVELEGCALVVESVSIPNRDFDEFQLIFPENRPSRWDLVSIPNRDFDEFQLRKQHSYLIVVAQVSIPNRDFDEFQPLRM